MRTILSEETIIRLEIEGFTAQRFGVPFLLNPYTEDSQEDALWASGWKAGETMTESRKTRLPTVYDQAARACYQ